MNKIRIFGIVLVLTGIVSIYTIDNSGYDFIFGMLTGIGVGLAITGKSIFTVKSKRI